MRMSETQNTKPLGRPPLPPGQARTATLRAMVRPDFAEEFRAVAERCELSMSDALHQAATEWLASKS